MWVVITISHGSLCPSQHACAMIQLMYCFCLSAVTHRAQDELIFEELKYTQNIQNGCVWLE